MIRPTTVKAEENIVLFKPPTFPQELTDAWWQRKKGVIAKMKTGHDGSGIGEQLRKLKREFDKIKWEPIDVFYTMPQQAGQRSADSIRKGRADAERAIVAIQVVHGLAADLTEAAGDLEKEWGRSRVIPKTSTAAARTVAEHARRLEFELSRKRLQSWVDKGIAEEAETVRKLRAEARQMVAKYPATMDKLIADLQNVTAPDQWQVFWSGSVRNTGTLLRKVQQAYPDSAADIADFRKACDHQSKPKDDQELAQWKRELDRTARALRAHLP